jgi:glutamine amidotransferase
VSIALIDYGAGNLTSVKKALAAVGARVFVPGAPDALGDAAGAIVPGVGHFDVARALEGGWTEAVLQLVGEGKPLLGICVGMQWLYEGSEEAPGVRGLGLLSGRCRRLTGGAGVKVPHVGWNSLAIASSAAILEGVPPGAQVYFTHSYAAPVTGSTVAVTEHGEPFAAVVARGNVAGVQFHPEKSAEAGLQVLRNFVRQCLADDGLS